MATQTSFESILDTPATEVERPKPLPAGTYSCIVRGLPEYGESSQKKTPFVRFILAVQSAGDDVDSDELQEIGGIADKTIRNTFYTTPDSMFRLTDFFTHLGIDQEGKTVRQCLSETPNCSVKITIGHTASQDGESIFAELKKTMAAE